MYTHFLSTQAENQNWETVPERLRRIRLRLGLTWDALAEKLGVSRGMLMMVMRDDRRLSAKALFKLEKLEREAADNRTTAERMVESLIGGRDIASRITGQSRKGRGTVQVTIDYTESRSRRLLPATVLLVAPSEVGCQKLAKLFAETLDTRLIALACLPEELQREEFIDQMTAESRARLTSAALDLVIPDWRTLVARDITNSKAA